MAACQGTWRAGLGLAGQFLLWLLTPSLHQVRPQEDEIWVVGQEDLPSLPPRVHTRTPASRCHSPVPECLPHPASISHLV